MSEKELKFKRLDIKALAQVQFEKFKGVTKNTFVKITNLSIKDVRKIFLKIILEFSSVIISLTIIWLAALGILMNRPSVDLTFVKPHYEHWFSEAFEGKTTKIDSYSAKWDQSRSIVQIHAQGIHINSGSGASQTIDHVIGSFRIKDTLWATPELVSLNITGGSLTVMRAADRRMQISLGTPEASGNVGALWKSETGTASRNLFGQIEDITVNTADIYFEDRLNGLELEFQNIDGTYSLIGDNIVFDAGGVLIMDANSQAVFSLEVHTQSDLKSIKANLDVNNLVPARIAPARGPIAVLSRLEAPIDLNAAVITGTNTGVEDLQFSFIAGAGALQTGTTFKPFSRARIEAHYDAMEKNIEVQALEIESEALDLKAGGYIQNTIGGITGLITQPISFTANIFSARLNPGRRFEGPLTLKPSTLSGTLDINFSKIFFDTLKLDFGSFQTDLSTGMQRDKAGFVTSVTADGVINGVMDKGQLLGFWPNDFALGARNWIRDSLQTGKISNLKIFADLDSEDIQNQQIADEHLNIKFDVHDGEVRYMRKMPWLRNAVGNGELQGNNAKFFVSSGSVDGLDITQGLVTIPKLSPHGGDFTIELYGNGPVNEMLRVSNFPPFEFSKNYGLDPSSFGGIGKIRLVVTRPLLEFFDQNRILYALSGEFKDVSIPVGVAGFNLNDGNLSLHADKNGIEISGPIQLGKWQTRLDWLKPLEITNTPAKYTLIGAISRDDLDAFGFGFRRNFGGEIGLHISGEGDGLAIQEADIFANFDQAEVNIGNFWHKPTGSKGNLSGRIIFANDGGSRFENVSVKSKGLDIQGNIALASDMRLISLNLPTVKIDQLLDATIVSKPMSDELLSVSIMGDYLNIETWANQVLNTQSSSLELPIELNAHLTKLKLNENYELTNARAQFSHNGDAITNALLSGYMKEGSFLTSIISNDVTQDRDIKIEIPDASLATLAFLGQENIKGGDLKINGKLPPAGEKGSLKGQVSLQNFTLIHAPAFTQILSLASLQGMADTLSGSGLKFNDMTLQFAMKDGEIKIRDGRASGPALGLTGEGNIDIANNTVDFNGVLVPSYSVNSILGDIPVLGNIMVGKKGEGMFALNYSVKGPFAQTQISVNPLSALTPGFLRRVFDVDRDKIEDPNIADLIKEQEKKDE